MAAPKSHLTQAEVNLILNYVSELRDFFRLGHWDIYLQPSPAEEEEGCEDSHACIRKDENYHSAALYVSSHWEKLPAVGKTSVLIHELLHLTHRGVDDVFFSVAEGPNISAAESVALGTRWSTQVERMVSAHTRLYEQFAPSWPGTVSTRGKGIMTAEEYRV